MQVAVDWPTIANMWHFLRDAHFVDATSQALTFRLAVANRKSHTVVLWRMILRVLPSGRLQSQAAFMDAPLLWENLGTFENVGSLAMHAITFLLSMAHTALVSGFYVPQPQLYDPSHCAADNPAEASRWFRTLCQAAFIGLSITLACSLCWNVVVQDKVNKYSMDHTVEAPSSAFLPAHMYHDLLSHARILLPAKQDVESATGDYCNVVRNGTGDNIIEIESIHDSRPIWARVDEKNGALENFTSLLVCPSLYQHLFRRSVARSEIFVHC